MPSLPGGKWDLDTLVYYLFGNPIDTKDLGLIGRMETRIDKLMGRVSTLINMFWAVILLLIAVLLTLAGNLIVSTHVVRP